MMLPLAAGWALNRPELLWVGLGGWLGSLADPGGLYRERAIAIATFAAAGGVLTFAGGVLASPVWVAAPALFACALLCSLVRVRGDTAATIGVLALTMFCITQGAPAPPGPSLARGALLAAGAVVALLVAVAFWPFRPYHPVRRAVSAAWTDLAGLVDDVHDAAAAAAPHAVWDGLGARRRTCREHLERARNAVAAARIGRQGETGRGLQLLVLYEIAELLLGDIAALTEGLRGRLEQGLPLPAAAVASLPDLAATYRDLAAAIVEQRAPPAPPSTPQPGESGEIAMLLARLWAGATQGRESVVALERGGAGPRQPGAPPARVHWPSLRDALAPGSLELQHALRVAIVTTSASLLAAALHFQRSYWVTVTAIIVLQPHGVATVRRALQRVGGTVVGGIFAALLTRLVRDPLELAPILFFLCWMAVAVRRMNYAAFATLITPIFVLLAEAGASGPHLTRTRIVDTLAGGALALVGGLTLWPTRELERMPALIAKVLGADLEYLRAVLRDSPEEALSATRRRIGLAAANAEAALQRLLGESHPSARVEPVMALLAFARRMSASITSLRDARPPPDVAVRLEANLAMLVEAAQGPTAPPPLLELDETPLAEPARRLARQMRGMHSALARLA
jgi:uncharacterized membrane protein YccC